MEKYIRAIESVIKLMIYWMKESKCTPEESLRRWGGRLSGIIEVAIYDTALTQDEFKKLQILIRDEKIIDRLEGNNDK